MQGTNIIRMAMPVSIPSDINQKMRGQDRGWAFDPDVEKTPPDLGVRRMEEVSPGFDLTLPKIFRYTPSDIRTINGKRCLVTYIEPPKEYQRITKATPQYVKDRLIGSHYPGVVRVINLDTGTPEEFSHDDVFDQIKGQAEILSEESRQKINKEIQAYNKRIDEIDAATANLSRLPLQIARAEQMVNERISVLDSMIAATEARIGEAQNQKPEGVGEMEEYVGQSIKGGNLPEKDFIDYVVHHYAYRYDQLVKDLQSGALVMPPTVADPENLKTRLSNMGQAAFDAYTAEKEKRKETKPPAAPFDIANQDIVGNLQELQEGDVPATYKSTGFHNLKGYIGSLYGTLEGCKKNRTSLVAISEGMVDIRSTIGSLPEGQRSKDYVEGEGGQVLLAEMADMCNNRLKGWTNTFSKNIVDEKGRIDTRHFGKSGSMGNAMLIVVLTRLFKIMSTFLKKSGWTPPDENSAHEMAGHVMTNLGLGEEAGSKGMVRTAQAEGSWTPGMTKAYEAGLDDAKAGRPADVSRGDGFEAAYQQGYSHGSKSAESNADLMSKLSMTGIESHMRSGLVITSKWGKVKDAN